MNYAEESLKLHKKWHGKLETVPKMEIHDKEALSLAYTPGVAQPCLEIQADPAKSYTLTGRGNTVAVVTDGTAVLVWATSARWLGCRSWRGNVSCSKPSAAWMLCPCA